MRVAALLTAILGMTLVACSMLAPTASPGPSLTVDCAAFETEGANGAPVQREIEAGINQTVTITLCANPSTGFSWEGPVGDGDAVVEVVERAIHQTIGGAPGEASEETFTFRTVSTGTAVLHFTYSQPWDGGTKGAWLLDVTTTVTEAAPGS